MKLCGLCTLLKFLMICRSEDRQKFLSTCLKKLTMANPQILTLYNQIIEESSSIYRKISADKSISSVLESSDSFESSSDSDDCYVNMSSSSKLNFQPSTSKNRFAAFDPDI